MATTKHAARSAPRRALIGRRAMQRAFASTVAASSTPYGYTITVWASGALLIRSRELPTVWEVFLFVLGAIAAFGVLWVLGHSVIAQAKPVKAREARAFAGVLDLFAVGVAAGAAALIAMIPSWIAWPLASFGATVLYIVIASLQLAVADRREAG